MITTATAHKITYGFVFRIPQSARTSGFVTLEDAVAQDPASNVRVFFTARVELADQVVVFEDESHESLKKTVRAATDPYLGGARV